MEIDIVFSSPNDVLENFNKLLVEKKEFQELHWNPVVLVTVKYMFCKCCL